ncbi:hypothetical protein [Ferrimonas gelatinilytica]|uniref:tRNA-modifying protein YgfZ n=1 Tax=Ferrimonas gelatinilytica TaxID=1255257 RepID=A0ABP9SE62_9GAMM
MTQVTEHTLIPLDCLGVLRARGDDRKSYLQSQWTCDLVKLPADQWHFGGHCDPKGKLIAPFRWLHHGDSILQLMPKTLLPLEHAALGKYAVFNKVEFDDATDAFELYALIGPGLTERFAAWAGNERLRHQGEQRLLIDGDHGLLLLPKGDALPAEVADLPHGEVAAFIASELQAGRPWMDAAHSGEFVPQMLNLDAIGGVQYDKGCYIGQETIARMHFRGGNKRALYVLCGPAGSDAEDAPLEMQVGENWRRAGTLVAQQVLGNTRWVTAVMNKSLEADTAFRFGDSPMTLQPLPYPLQSDA